MAGFELPPYPHDRLEELRAVASAAVGDPSDVVDLSVGNPGDPLPEVVAGALAEALDRGVRYPPSVGFHEYRVAACAWMDRRFGVDVDPDQVAACVGTKEVVASLPRLLSLREPGRDVVLHPAVSYPTYEMGARLAELRSVPVPLDEGWRPRLEGVSDADARRALVLWLNEPGNPTGSVVDADWYEDVVAWARERGIVVASDECYAEFVFDGDPSTALSAGSDGVLAVHSLSKRSNMAGLRSGFVAGDPALVRYLGEMRKHAGLMTPGPVQVAGAAAWDDDAHVEEQRDRYRSRRQAFLGALAGTGIEHTGGPATFYLWLREEGRDGWALARRFAEVGILVAPGEFYGKDGHDHARVALVEPEERFLPLVHSTSA